MMLFLRRLSYVAFFLIGSAHPAYAFDLWPFDEEGIDFTVRVDGIQNLQKPEKLAEQLEEAGRSAIDPDNPPETIAQLRASAGLMSRRVQKALVARAWYDAQVQANIKEKEGETPLVIFVVEPGDYYTVATNRVEWEASPLDVADLQEAFLSPGAAAQASDINAAAKGLQDRIAQDRCLLSLDVKPLVILDTPQKQAEIIYRVAHGPAADFGPTHFTGATKVDEAILRKKLQWAEGECFTQEKVVVTQTSLLESKLIASTNVHVAEEPNEEGEVPVEIEVKDRSHRTVTAGVSYGTTEGAGITSSWEHRNLFGEAHNYKVDGVVSELQYSINNNYTIPYFWRDDQQLRLSGGISHETTDAYDSDNISLLSGIDRDLTSDLKVGVGLGARFSSIAESGEEQQEFGLLFIPVYAEWDSRDDVLNPKRGWFIRGSVALYSDVTGQGVSFLKSQGNAQTYLTAEALPYQPTLALRASLGQINGASTQNVPADLRFYAGGGGSVRGYGYQAIGPYDNGEPDGGTAWSEVSAEVRLRFTDTLGGVVFFDGGTVYDKSTPNPVEELYTSAGIGARYFSPIGPLRFDIGFPLNEIEEDDTGYGVYISIGQAF